MSSFTNRRGLPLGLLAAVALAFPAATAAVTPTPANLTSATNYAINTGPMDTYDAHVSGDIASYTAGARIRYYNFFTGLDQEVPWPGGSTDFLSDVSAGRIVLTRNIGGGAHIIVFDTSTSTTIDLDPHPASLRINPSIAANTVAFIDQANATGELYASFLGGATSQLTSDTRYDQNTSVAPLGDRIVYESCATDPSDCSIRMATWTGAVWQMSDVTADGGGAEANPDSDGVTVVYDAYRTGDREIAWQSVPGGPEQVLTMAGAQRNPSVSSGIIAFESVPVGVAEADLFVYEIASNRLFQVTVSPSIDDTLNNISVLPSGAVRIVWSEGGFGARDVRGADVVLPPVGPTYSFGGFQQPVDARPTLNSMKAGAAVPVKFSLGGNQGMNIFAAGYPKSQAIACNDAVDVDGIETTVTAGGSSLTYDPATNTYIYIWKTDKAWAGTCRQLVLEFADAGSTTARANFKFK